jgi:NAD(P)H-dependent FMN reductase
MLADVILKVTVYNKVMVTIKIIIGSTRPNRFGPQVANWLMQLASDQKDAKFELIDLKEVGLPFLDEPEPPSGGNYVQEHTKKWSATIKGADGFVWVHPEYNHGMNAALKNALDFLWREWNDKPVALASYGAAAGGSRAAEQLRLVAAALKMFDLRAQVIIADYKQYLDATGNFVPTDGQIKAANSMLRELVFWAGQMQRGRRQLVG